ncbi:MAG: hypothetical protein AAF927_01595 [Bacteroidota bacterium]
MAVDPVSIVASSLATISTSISEMVGGKQRLKLADANNQMAINDQIVSQRKAQEQSQQIIVAILALITVALVAATIRRSGSG